ncbi:DUF6284 family protein [Streptomyces sp. NPDC002896]|uniref:DUF6284 family protein n=1 Tax=Streptomyces sp. NPDC002896 TaxID=3154438 RepID=UPI003320A450
MKLIVPAQKPVTTDPAGEGPSDAELDAIERESPLIMAEVELLDVQISLLDRPATELGARRLRRARRKVLNVRRELTNQTTATVSGVGA